MIWNDFQVCSKRISFVSKDLVWQSFRINLKQLNAERYSSISMCLQELLPIKKISLHELWILSVKSPQCVEMVRMMLDHSKVLQLVLLFLTTKLLNKSELKNANWRFKEERPSKKKNRFYNLRSDLLFQKWWKTHNLPKITSKNCLNINDQLVKHSIQQTLELEAQIKLCLN